MKSLAPLSLLTNARPFEKIASEAKEKTETERLTMADKGRVRAAQQERDHMKLSENSGGSKYCELFRFRSRSCRGDNWAMMACGERRVLRVAAVAAAIADDEEEKCSGEGVATCEGERRAGVVPSHIIALPSASTRAGRARQHRVRRSASMAGVRGNTSLVMMMEMVRRGPEKCVFDDENKNWKGLFVIFLLRVRRRHS